VALRFLLRFPAFSQKEQNGPFFTFPWRFQKFLTALRAPPSSPLQRPGQAGDENTPPPVRIAPQAPAGKKTRRANACFL